MNELQKNELIKSTKLDIFVTIGINMWCYVFIDLICKYWINNIIQTESFHEYVSMTVGSTLIIILIFTMITCWFIKIGEY